MLLDPPADRRDGIITAGKRPVGSRYGCKRAGKAGMPSFSATCGAVRVVVGEQMNQPLSGYREFIAASIHGRTTSRFSEAHRLAPASGSSSSLITVSRPLICSSVSASSSMNA